MNRFTSTALLALLLAVPGEVLSTGNDAGSATKPPALAQSASSTPVSLKETRMALDKWIETQQIISKERKDWQQGKEILSGRLEMVKREIAVLEEKTGENKTSVSESEQKHKDLEIENDLLKQASQQLGDSVTGMEKDVRRLFESLPDPLKEKLRPLYDRVPVDASSTRVSIAERFQNVLGILNELNKANNEISVSYEVHTLADGKSSEVKAVYVGLAQAYYVSPRGEGGIGKPAQGGWKWEASDDVAPQVTTTLEILEGKHSPIFVPMPVEVQ